jgi:hypothetical protein
MEMSLRIMRLKVIIPKRLAGIPVTLLQVIAVSTEILLIGYSIKVLIMEIALDRDFTCCKKESKEAYIAPFATGFRR